MPKCPDRCQVRLAQDIFGPQLESVELIYRGYWSQPEERPAEWISCTSIESAKFKRYPSLDDIRGFLQEPKSLLKFIDLKISPENGGSKEIISLIARRTGALEKLTLRCPEPAIDEIEKLVERNKSLSHVQIYFHGSLPEMKKTNVDSFLKCPSLKKLSVDDKDSMEENCNIDTIPAGQNIPRSRRHRRICISAFGKISMSRRTRLKRCIV